MLLSAVLWTVLDHRPALSAPPGPADLYTRSVRPLLESRCLRCHGAEKQQGGLRLDQRSNLLAGGESGDPAVVPGRSDQSLLISRITAVDKALVMPPGGERLTAEQVALLKTWIDSGAHVGEEAAVGAAATIEHEISEHERQFWAYQPVRPQVVPPVWNHAWPRGTIDRFLLSRLEKEGLTPAPDADRLTWLRRIRFDLTGLPPTLEEVADFRDDQSPGLYERLVDRLLASPEFGERWGRHWLDITYWADTTGVGRRTPLRDAWRYRDYVIEAFNADRSIAQFIREQIAGDLLPADTETDRERQSIATGFLVLGPWDFSVIDKLQMQMDIVDLQIDLVGRAVLGQSLGCARCHDHKFDPIPTRDYYALAGIFGSTRILQKRGGDWDRHARVEFSSRKDLDRYADDLEAWEGVVADLAGLQTTGRARQELMKARRDELKKEAANAAAAPAAVVPQQSDAAAAPGSPVANAAAREQEIASIQQQIQKLEAEIARARRVEAHQKMLKPRPAGGYSAADVEDPSDARINLRGNVRALGDPVPRGFLRVLPVGQAASIAAGQSGRRELADWLASDSNPLTPRVYVNRVWHHLFGVGLVPTVDNFGSRGDRPSHPELLDYLASRLVASNWSTKTLVREIVLSRAYQMSSGSSPQAALADPGNRLLWRMNRRRLEAEAIRDSILVASGGLDPQAGGPTLPLTVENLFENATPFIEDHSQVPAAIYHRRAVYLPVLRGSQLNALDILSLFDFADPDQVVGARTPTTVPLQSLFLLNSPFMKDESRRLAERLLADTGAGNGDRVRRLYLLAYGRPAESAEIEQAWEVLEKLEEDFRALQPVPASPRLEAWARFCQAILASAEFLYRK